MLLLISVCLSVWISLNLVCMEIRSRVEVHHYNALRLSMGRSSLLVLIQCGYIHSIGIFSKCRF